MESLLISGFHMRVFNLSNANAESSFIYIQQYKSFTLIGQSKQGMSQKRQLLFPYLLEVTINHTKACYKKEEHVRNMKPYYSPKRNLYKIVK